MVLSSCSTLVWMLVRTGHGSTTSPALVSMVMKRAAEVMEALGCGKATNPSEVRSTLERTTTRGRPRAAAVRAWRRPSAVRPVVADTTRMQKAGWKVVRPERVVRWYLLWPAKSRKVIRRFESRITWNGGKCVALCTPVMLISVQPRFHALRSLERRWNP